MFLVALRTSLHWKVPEKFSWFITKATFLYLKNDGEESGANVIIQQGFSKENIFNTKVKQKDNSMKFSSQIFVIPWMLAKNLYRFPIPTLSQILYLHWGAFSLFFIRKLFEVGVLVFLLLSLVLYLGDPLSTQCKFKKIKEKFK